MCDIRNPGTCGCEQLVYYINMPICPFICVCECVQQFPTGEMNVFEPITELDQLADRFRRREHGHAFYDVDHDILVGR